MLSEKVLPVTRNLICERLSKSTTATGFLLSAYSTTPAGVMTSSGSGSPDVPRRNPRTRPLSLVKTRQLAGALPWPAWPRTACGSSMPGSRISLPGDLAATAHPHYRGRDGAALPGTGPRDGTAEADAAGEAPGNRRPGRVLIRRRPLQESRTHAAQPGSPTR